MREDNLLCVRKRKFVVTTDFHHARKIYPNLAQSMILMGIDQLWIADITYIRLREEFVFWPSFWMPTRAASSAGRWIERWEMNSPWRPSASRWIGAPSSRA